MLSVSTRVPGKEPVAVGTKSTPTAQELPAAMGVDVEQVVVAESSLKFVLATMLLKLRAAFPMFWTETVFGLSVLVDPILVDAKLKLGGVAKFSIPTVLLV